MDTTSQIINNGTVRFLDTDSSAFGGASSSSFVNYGTVEINVPNGKTMRINNFDNYNVLNLNSGNFFVRIRD